MSKIALVTGGARGIGLGITRALVAQGFTVAACGRSPAAKAAAALAEKYHVEMPIVAEVNKVLFEGKSAAEAVRDLMIRDKKVETPMLPWE